MRFQDCVIVIYFVQQKTENEMRINDWSSDVCSADLTRRQRRKFGNALGKFLQPLMFAYRTVHARAPRTSLRIGDMQHWPAVRPRLCLLDLRGQTQQQTRSEEHTSELQSLMRISYAVFCLKKKKKRQTNTQITT